MAEQPRELKTQINIEITKSALVAIAEIHARSSLARAGCIDRPHTTPTTGSELFTKSNRDRVYTTVDVNNKNMFL